MYENNEMKILENNKGRFSTDILDLISNIKQIYANYNKRYSKYTKNYIKTMESTFNTLQISPFISSKWGGNLLETTLNQENFDKILDVLEKYYFRILNLKYLNFLSEEKRNVILIGPNGCGKTTLLRHLKSLTGEDIVSYYQADRLLLVNAGYNPERDEARFQQAAETTYKQATNIDSNNQSYYIEQQFNISIAQFEKVRSEELELINSNDLKSEMSKTNYIINIWNNLIKDRVLFCRGTLKVKTKEGEEYPIKYLSSGERSIFYFLSSIILNEQKQYYFIDEPENNLNPSVVSLLWNIIERYYPDSIFVYLTHDSDFVASRVNTKNYWIQKYDGKEWKYQKLPENNDLPKELMIELVGNRQPVLFCESENEDKYDTIIYKMLFPEFKVVSAGGCDKVCSKVKAYYEVGLPQKAFGIIDCDYKDDYFLNGQIKNNIYHLPYFEIENFMASEEILIEVLKKFHKVDIFDIIKNDIKKDFILKKEQWIVRKIAHELRGIYYNRKINNLKDIQELKNNYNECLAKYDIDIRYNELSEFFDSVALKDDYNFILRYYDNKNNLFKIIEDKLQIENFDYANETLQLLNKEGDVLLDNLRNKCFPCVKNED